MSVDAKKTTRREFIELTVGASSALLFTQMTCSDTNHQDGTVIHDNGPDGDADTDTDTASAADTNTGTDTDSDTDTDTDADTNSDGDSDSDTDGDSDGDTDSDAGFEDQTLFSEGRIGSMLLKNRLVRAATWESLAANGYVSDTYIDLMVGLAQGGVGMIISGYTGPVQADASPKQIHVFHDRYIDGLGRVADAVHGAAGDCRLLAQVGHSGTGVGPSAFNWPWKGSISPLTTVEVEEIVTGFAQAIRRVRDAGWDGVELHGAHHYLLSSFLSPYTNTRTDKYGGSTEKRVRIVKDIVAQARQLVGDDFPILIKVNSEDGVSGGIDGSHFRAVASEIEKAGVDAIEVSGADPIKAGIGTIEEQSYFVEAAGSLNVNLPIIVTGGHRSVEHLAGIVKTGGIDFLGLARPLIREPGLPNRWRDGKGSTEADCINCNRCFNEGTMNGLPLQCFSV